YRPARMYIPAIQGRSEMSGYLRPQDTFEDMITESGLTGATGHTQINPWREWVQNCETDFTASPLLMTPGTPVHSRFSPRHPTWQEFWKILQQDPAFFVEE